MADRNLNVADEAQVNRQRNLDKIEDLQNEVDLRAVMASPEGRRFIWRLMIECGVGESPFATNALLMSRSAGKQEIGLWLQAEVAGVAPSEYLKMQTEHWRAVQKEEADYARTSS
jgi:hypothetical protein